MGGCLFSGDNPQDRAVFCPSLKDNSSRDLRRQRPDRALGISIPSVSIQLMLNFTPNARCTYNRPSLTNLLGMVFSNRVSAYELTGQSLVPVYQATSAGDWISRVMLICIVPGIRDSGQPQDGKVLAVR